MPTTTEPPLSKQEIREWVRGLGQSDHQRIRVILNLLANKVEDKMSAEDQRICTEQLGLLQEKVAAEKAAKRVR